MTTEADYKSNNTMLFRAPFVQNYENYNNSNLTNGISKFVVNVTENPFSFKIIDSAGNLVYNFDGKKVYFSEFLVFDTGTF